MKLASRIVSMALCALALLIWTLGERALAQTSYGIYDDGMYTVYMEMDYDGSTVSVFLDDFEQDFTSYEVIADFMGPICTISGSDGSYASSYGSCSLAGTPGSTYEGEIYYQITYWNAEDGDGDPACDADSGECYDSPNAEASLTVPYPPPVITSLSTYSVNQGDTGTDFTITGTNLVQYSGDQLTLNFSGSAGNPFTLTSAPSSCEGTCTATFSYDFSFYPTGSYTLSVSNYEGTSNSETFTVNSSTVDNACSVTTNPNAGFSSITPTTAPVGSGTMLVSFSGAESSYSTLSQTVPYGPYSTPSSIASATAALVTRNFFQYGLSAKAFGTNVIYSGNAKLGTVNTQFTSPGTDSPPFAPDTSSTAAAAAAAECFSAVSTSTPIPTSVPILRTVYSGQPSPLFNDPGGPQIAECDAGTAGWERKVWRQVLDQNGQPIQDPGQQLHEDVTPVPGQNGLSLYPAPKDGSTDVEGQFPDTFSFCSSVCLTNPTATTTFKQVVTDTWNNVLYPVGTYMIKYSCSKIFVNGNLSP